MTAHEPVPLRIRLAFVSHQEHVPCVRFGAREGTRPVVRVLLAGERCHEPVAAELSGENASEAGGANHIGCSENGEDARPPTGLFEAAGCLQLPCELDCDRMAERRVAFQQAVERRTGDLEQLRVAHRLRPGGAHRTGQEGQLAESRSRPELPDQLGAPSRVTTIRSRPDSTT